MNSCTLIVTTSIEAIPRRESTWSSIVSSGLLFEESWILKLSICWTRRMNRFEARDMQNWGLRTISFWQNRSASTISKSQPPRHGSPDVLRTTSLFSFIDNRLTSTVPAPMSQINAYCAPLGRSGLHSRAAALGSYTTSITFNPASSAATIVSWICIGVKLAGTVTTASLITDPYASEAREAR